jgi:hypothetical protein
MLEVSTRSIALRFIAKYGPIDYGYRPGLPSCIYSIAIGPFIAIYGPAYSIVDWSRERPSLKLWSTAIAIERERPGP